MGPDEFITAVADRLDGVDRDKARRSSTAVLQALAAALSPEEAGLAAQLPRDLADEVG